MSAIGEVLSSSITNLSAECWAGSDEDAPPDAVPRFGSFLRVDSAAQGLQIFAVVYDLITGPQDSLHKPAALKMTREQLRVEQPQIFSLLKTEILAAIIGCQSGGEYRCGLPPLPPQVHDFIFPATSAEIQKITEGLDFIRLISKVHSVPNDELVVATIQEACSARNGDYQFLVEAGQSLAQVLGDDYNRLTAALRKLRP